MPSCIALGLLVEEAEIEPKDTSTINTAGIVSQSHNRMPVLLEAELLLSVVKKTPTPKKEISCCYFLQSPVYW